MPVEQICPHPVWLCILNKPNILLTVATEMFI